MYYFAYIKLVPHAYIIERRAYFCNVASALRDR
jgi:hypothetical protein